MVNGGLRIVSGHETRRDEAGASHCPSMGSMDSVSLLQLLSQLTSHLSDRYWRQSVSKYSLIVLKPISSSCGQLLLRNLLGRMPEYRDRGETLCYQNLNNTADCRIEVIETYHRGSPAKDMDFMSPLDHKGEVYIRRRRTARDQHLAPHRRSPVYYEHEDYDDYERLLDRSRSLDPPRRHSRHRDGSIDPKPPHHSTTNRTRSPHPPRPPRLLTFFLRQ